MTIPEEMLEVSTREHQMTVLRDDGLYRHIRFAKPGTSIWRFDLVTWPGHLVITGDLEDFHFARIPDMFEFFRSPVGYINEHYWSEKLCGPQRSMSYSPELFRKYVFEYFWENRDYYEPPSQRRVDNTRSLFGDRPASTIDSEASYRSKTELWRAIREELLRYADDYDETAAHMALQDFRHGTFDFTDTYEWELKDYDFHFRLSLHAIVWGINRYDAAKAMPIAPSQTERPIVTVAPKGVAV